MAKAVLDFSQAGDFTPDNPSQINFTGSQAELNKTLDQRSDIQDFTSSVGFTYDVNDTEFTGTRMQQIDKAATTNAYYRWNSNLQANYNLMSVDPTCTPFNGAVIDTVNDVLDLHNGGYVLINPSVISQNAGTIRFIFVPRYSGTPVANQDIIFAANLNGTLNRIRLQHRTNGFLNASFTDDTGFAYFGKNITFNPVSGTEYEIEINFDLNGTNGTCYLFLDGVLGASETGITSVRSSDVADTRYGNANGSGNFDLYNLIIKNQATHSVDYASPISPELFRFTRDSVLLPVMTNLTADTQSYAYMTATSANARFTVNGLYWGGSAWLPSNGTSWQQGSSVSNISNNLSTHPDVLDDILIGVIFRNGDNQGYVENLTFGYNGLAFPTEALITWNSDPSMDNFLTMSQDAIIPAGTQILWHFAAQGVKFWYNPSTMAWEQSDGTPSQSNTISQIAANADLWDLSPGKKVRPSLWLTTSNTQVTPSIAEAEIQYLWNISPVAMPAVTTVFGVLLGKNDQPVENATIEIFYHSKGIAVPYVAEGVMIPPSEHKVTTNDKGEWQQDLVASQLYNRSYQFKVSYYEGESLQPTTEDWGYYEIPSQSEINLADLTPSTEPT